MNEPTKKSTGTWQLVVGGLLLLMGLNNIFSRTAFVSGAGAEGAGYNGVTIIILVFGLYLIYKGYKLHKK